ncbi:MAG: hypothetical protein EOR16_30185 [Mesorhizobium sp.]|uniref:SemiSWEET family sugar transporter n=1 Tax=Mesorhizobium sp. TaxID=1871066 RepID=UPI000FE80EA9|nr:PQ-loop domain-containing transporter [Mesorhizobium sp.]RWI50530.1 MAG: hypothetical protein EOR16_30185 [Mesorhizobium sp.]
MSNGIELLGTLAAVLTTFASLPQVLKILRDRQTRDISLLANGTLALGILLWAVYGLGIGSFTLFAANSVSLLFIAAIIAMKVWFG